MSPSPARRLLRAAAAIALALAIAPAPGCGAASPRALTPQEIDAHGVIVLRASPERVFKASVEALKALGYEIETETPEKGLVVTKRRSMPSATEHNYFRQYTLEIKSGGGGTSRVRATPALFDNEENISAKKVWDLESSLGEHEMWKQLFARIEQLL